MHLPVARLSYACCRLAPSICRHACCHAASPHDTGSYLAAPSLARDSQARCCHSGLMPAPLPPQRRAAQCARVKPLWKCDELSEAQCAVECAPKEPPEEEEDSCDACPRSYLPHCGKDGAVYPNLCLLKVRPQRLEVAVQAASWRAPGTPCLPPAPRSTAQTDCGETCLADRYHHHHHCHRTKCMHALRLMTPAGSPLPRPAACLLQCARVELLFPCADGEDCADACQQSAAVCGCDLLSAVAEVCGYSGAVYQHPCFARCAGDRIRCGQGNTRGTGRRGLGEGRLGSDAWGRPAAAKARRPLARDAGPAALPSSYPLRNRSPPAGSSALPAQTAQLTASRRPPRTTQMSLPTTAPARAAAVAAQSTAARPPPCGLW